MKYTNNLKLSLYEPDDMFNITGETNSLNHNMKIIDNALISNPGGVVVREENSVYVENEYNDLQKANSKLQQLIITFEDASKVEVLNSNEIKSMSEVSKVYKKMPDLVHQKDELDKELDRTKNINTLLNFYKSKIDHVDSQNKGLRDKLIMLRSQYNSVYHISYNPNSSDNTLYDEELAEFEGNKLVDYQEKITIAKANAISQFKDDFLAKLKSNFDTVKMQIEALNDALSGSKFGNDSYHFIMNPRVEYKNYYEMITDPLLMEG